MASLSAAILSDFAQVRDNLLFVSSGGITRVSRPEFPTKLGCMVGMLIYVEPKEDLTGTVIGITVTTSAAPDFDFQATTEIHSDNPEKELSPDPSYIAAVVDMRELELPAPGTYHVTVTMGDESTSFSFNAKDTGTA